MSANVIAESTVLIGTEPTNLLCDCVVPGSLQVRDRCSNPTVIYVEGSDYEIQHDLGQIRRTRHSRIPDFSSNMLWGKNDFNHNDFQGCGNQPYFAWLDYQTQRPFSFPKPATDASFLARSTQKLLSGGTFRLITFGDSITAGADLSDARFLYSRQFAAELSRRYPAADVQLQTQAIPGDTTEDGLRRVGEVVAQSPDLVLVAFGMNDHNRADVGGIPPERYAENLIRMVSAIVEKTTADVIVISSPPPHPDWHFGTHQMDRYARAVQEVVAACDCAMANVHDLWTQVLRRKDASSLLANNINHPTEFGHSLYVEVLRGLGI